MTYRVHITDELRDTYSNESGVQVCWEWCNKQFGPSKPERGGTWYMKGNTFFFEKEADATMFALRWA